MINAYRSIREKYVYETLAKQHGVFKYVHSVSVTLVVNGLFQDAV
jgi:hypothetical protein